jgi:hypothetical protein
MIDTRELLMFWIQRYEFYANELFFTLAFFSPATETTVTTTAAAIQSMLASRKAFSCRTSHSSANAATAANAE